MFLIVFVCMCVWGGSKTRFWSFKHMDDHGSSAIVCSWNKPHSIHVWSIYLHLPSKWAKRHTNPMDLLGTEEFANDARCSLPRARQEGNLGVPECTVFFSMVFSPENVANGGNEEHCCHLVFWGLVRDPPTKKTLNLGLGTMNNCRHLVALLTSSDFQADPFWEMVPFLKQCFSNESQAPARFLIVL